MALSVQKKQDKFAKTLTVEILKTVIYPQTSVRPYNKLQCVDWNQFKSFKSDRQKPWLNKLTPSKLGTKQLVHIQQNEIELLQLMIKCFIVYNKQLQYNKQRFRNIKNCDLNCYSYFVSGKYLIYKLLIRQNFLQNDQTVHINF